MNNVLGITSVSVPTKAVTVWYDETEWDLWIYTVHAWATTRGDDDDDSVRVLPLTVEDGSIELIPLTEIVGGGNEFMMGYFTDNFDEETVRKDAERRVERCREHDRIAAENRRVAADEMAAELQKESPLTTDELTQRTKKVEKPTRYARTYRAEILTKDPRFKATNRNGFAAWQLAEAA